MMGVRERQRTRFDIAYRDVKYFIGTRHTFALHNSVEARPNQKSCHKDAGHTALLIPSRTSETCLVPTHLPFADSSLGHDVPATHE